MTCAKCGKQPVEKTIATKTSRIGDLVVVEQKRQALVCECGVLAWDPTPAPAINHPYAPLAPQLPRPYPVYTPPGTVTPPQFPPRFPYITC